MAGFGREAGFSSTTVGLDLQRFYENVRLSHLLEAAKMHHFPLKVVRGLCCIYAGWRAVLFEGCISSSFEAWAAIVAGCSGATSMARLLLLSPLKRASAAGPCVSLRNVVDDVLVNVTGTRCPVVKRATACVDSLPRNFAGPGLPLAPGKTKHLASDAALDRELQGSWALPASAKVRGPKIYTTTTSIPLTPSKERGNEEEGGGGEGEEVGGGVYLWAPHEGSSDPPASPETVR